MGGPWKVQPHIRQKQSRKSKESNVIEKWKKEDHKFRISRTEPELHDTPFQNKESRRRVNQHSIVRNPQGNLPK